MLFIVPSVLVKGIGLKHGLVERSIAYFVLFIACAELALPDQSYLYWGRSGGLTNPGQTSHWS